MFPVLLFAAHAAPISPKAVLDTGRGVVYLMAPGKRLEARALADGAVVWETTEAARPLALREDYLIAQVDRRDPATGSLPLVVLDARTGATIRTCAVGIPGHGAGIDDALEASLRVAGTWEDGAFLVTWTARRWHAGGVALTPEDEERTRQQFDGSIRCDPDTGQASHLSAARPTPPMVPPPGLEVSDRFVTARDEAGEVIWQAWLHHTAYTGPYPP